MCRLNMSQTVHRHVSETFDFSGKIYYNENTDANIRYLIFEKANCRQGAWIQNGIMKGSGRAADYGGIYE